MNTNTQDWNRVIPALREADLVASHSFDPTKMNPSTAMLTMMDEVDEWSALDVLPLYDMGVDLETLDRIVPDTETPVTGADDHDIRTDGGVSRPVTVLVQLEQYVFSVDPLGGIVDVYDLP